MTSIRFIRIALAMISLLAASALTAAVDHFGFEDLFNRPLPCLIFSATIIGFVGSLYGVFAPADRLQSMSTQLGSLAAPQFDSLDRSQPGNTRFRSQLLIAYGLLTFALVASRFYDLHQQVSHSDPAAFLRFATEVHDSGGPWNLLMDLYSGEYRQANQHPLLIGLLALHPTLTFAKTLSLVASCLTLGIILVHVMKKHGVWPAGLVLSLMCTNSALVYFASLATCESLLILILTSVFVLLMRLQPDPDRTTTHSIRRYHWRWFTIGALLGLSYLTKGTAPIFLAGVVAGCFVMNWKHVNQTSFIKRLGGTLVPVLILIIGWITVAHPLLIRNIKVFGNPLYSANQTFFYLDEFPDGMDPFGQVAAMGTPQEIRAEYFATHSVQDMSQRALTGMGWQTYTFVRSLGPTPLDDSRVLFGVLLLFLAGLVLIHSSPMIKTTMTVWIALGVLLFGWYIPIATGQRFMAPLIPMLLTFAGVGIWRVLYHFHQLPRATTALIIGFTWNAIWLIWTTITIWPEGS